MTLINKIALSILVTKRIYTNSEWNLWADNWLSGKDRRGVTASTAAAIAYDAATVYASTTAYDAATAYDAIAVATAAAYDAAIAAAIAYDASAITTIAAAYASKSLYLALQTSIELNITIDIQAEFKTALTIK